MFFEQDGSELKIVLELTDFPKRELLKNLNVDLPEHYDGSSEDPYLVDFFNLLIEKNHVDAFYLKSFAANRRYARLINHMAFQTRFGFDWDTNQIDTIRKLASAKFGMNLTQAHYWMGFIQLRNIDKYEGMLSKAKASQAEKAAWHEMNSATSSSSDHTMDYALKEFLKLFPKAKQVPTEEQMFWVSSAFRIIPTHEDVRRAYWDMVFTRPPKEILKFLTVLWNLRGIKGNITIGDRAQMLAIMSFIKGEPIDEAIKIIKSLPSEWLEALNG